MNAALIALGVLTAALLAAAPAAAWDPEDPDVPDPAPDAAVPLPEGLYLVTDTYVDAIVTRTGPVTTYVTETVHETTGSYARVLETVSTGSASVLDGQAFNGRASLTDGRPVAGTYYENYIRTDAGYVPVSVVFFQDDLEIARAVRPAVPAIPDPGLGPTAPAPQPSSAAGGVTPVLEGPRGSRDPAGSVRAAIPSEPAGPALLPALPDRAMEVLRARRIAISFTDPGPVRWRAVPGEAILLGPSSGGASEPCQMRWDRLAPSGTTWTQRFVLEFPGGVSRELVIRVTVRAPGLIG